MLCLGDVLFFFLVTVNSSNKKSARVPPCVLCDGQDRAGDSGVSQCHTPHSLVLFSPRASIISIP